MLGPLTSVSMDELMNATGRILARPGELTAFSYTELDQINQEVERRTQDDNADNGGVHEEPHSSR
jgi:hypothetical protein